MYVYDMKLSFCWWMLLTLVPVNLIYTPQLCYISGCLTASYCSLEHAQILSQQHVHTHTYPSCSWLFYCLFFSSSTYYALPPPPHNTLCFTSAQKKTEFLDKSSKIIDVYCSLNWSEAPMTPQTVQRDLVGSLASFANGGGELSESIFGHVTSPIQVAGGERVNKGVRKMVGKKYLRNLLKLF